MKNFLLALCFLLSINVLKLDVYADDTLGIGTSYLPNQINLLHSNDLVTNILKNNLITYFINKEDAPKDNFKPRQISKSLESDKEFWNFEFIKKPPISQNKYLSPEIIISTFEYFKKNKVLYNIPENKNFIEIIDNVKKITYEEKNINSFLLKMEVAKNNQLFLDHLSVVPLLDAELAEIFGNEIGKNTTMPTFGYFQIKDRNENQIDLIRNSYFDYSSDGEKVLKVSFKKFDSSDQRLKAIRSGSISIIVAPSLRELENTKNDPTLLVLDCPFKNLGYSIEENQKFDQTDQQNQGLPTENKNVIFDLQSIIVRKSLLLDQFFLKLYQLQSISEKLL